MVALDVDAGRVRMIDGARHRIGLPHLFPLVGDARTPAPARRAPSTGCCSTRPCSGIGVLRRRPDARWRLQPEAIAELAALQRDLLAAAAPLVRPGGILVYSVCTLTTEETHRRRRLGRRAPPRLHRASRRRAHPWTPHGRGALLLPQAAGTDGMFVLALRAPRSAEAVGGPVA